MIILIGLSAYRIAGRLGQTVCRRRNYHSLIAADYGRHSEQIPDFAAVAAVVAGVDSGIAVAAVVPDAVDSVESSRRTPEHMRCFAYWLVDAVLVVPERLHCCACLH